MKGKNQRGTPEVATGPASERTPDTPGRPRRVDKPWGYELVWAETDLYVGKLLHVNAGESLSLQFHEEKDETLFLLEGEVLMDLGAGVNSLEPVRFEEGANLRIRPGTLHRIEAVTDATILEASTTELDDVVRIRDRYGRVGPEEANGG
ncbi:MAG: cupin [Gemmatimonadota bacterium]